MTWAKPPARVKQWEGPTPTPRAAPVRIADHKARLVVPLPKDAPVRSEAYRRLVADMPCAHCGRQGPSQCAHSDSGGKGMGIKSSDLTCYPACADAPMRRGCHSIIGAAGMFTRAARTELETQYATQTRAKIVADGSWPESLSKLVNVRGE